jgi:hypothetical protein
MEVYDVRCGSQSPTQFAEKVLSRSDRRILLGASLRLLLRRLASGRPVFRSDVVRAAALADDAGEAERTRG